MAETASGRRQRRAPPTAPGPASTAGPTAEARDPLLGCTPGRLSPRASPGLNRRDAGSPAPGSEEGRGGQNAGDLSSASLLQKERLLSRPRPLKSPVPPRSHQRALTARPPRVQRALQAIAASPRAGAGAEAGRHGRRRRSAGHRWSRPVEVAPLLRALSSRSPGWGRAGSACPPRRLGALGGSRGALVPRAPSGAVRGPQAAVALAAAAEVLTAGGRAGSRE